MKSIRHVWVVIVVLLPSVLMASELPRTESAEGARVYIISPSDGDTVVNPITVRFGLSGMGVAPAGIDLPGTGHHHLLIDQESLPPMDLPMANSVMHFGAGQTEVEISLEPGKHTLQLLLGDKLHIPHDPPVVSNRITITVAEQ